MIRDVDESLCAWIGEMLAGKDKVQVTVGLPSTAAGQGQPGLFLFLASVRLDTESSLAAWGSVHAADELVVGRTPPLRCYRLTYLVVPHARDHATEHDLLGRVLAGGAVSDVVPAEHLRGSLAGATGDVLATYAPAESGADASALWLAWGLAPRTTVELSVLAPLRLAYVAEVAPPPAEIVVGTRAGEPAASRAANGQGASRAPLRPPPRGRISEG